MEPVEPIFANDRQSAESVVHAANEVDAAGLGEIANGHRDIAKPEAEANCLNQELGVKNEIVGVVLKRNPLENFAAIDAEAAVKISQILAQGHVFDGGQDAVAEVFVLRHAAVERFIAAANPAADHQIANP